MNRPFKKMTIWAGVVVGISSVMTIVLTLAAPVVHAQCPPLTSRECQLENSVPQDYSIDQSKLYWTVVGVIPSLSDDKDIYMYPSCPPADPLASSTGVNGTDFIVGDFNHTPPGMYYPEVTFGGASTSYNVYWSDGGAIFPVSVTVGGILGGTGATCSMMHVWDVLLEAGFEYRVSWDPPVGTEAHVALFRNPGTEPFWTGRAASEWEMTNYGSLYYFAPATDLYGLVVFPTWDLSTPEIFEVDIERLFDCRPLDPGVCVSEQLYSVANGPADDYLFGQEFGYWTVVAVSPDTLDSKVLEIYTECDQNGTYLGGSFMAGTGETEFVVGDFNHNDLGNYFVNVVTGQTYLPFTIEWDSGPDIFPVPGEILGYMSGTEDDCDLVQIWDVFLESGNEYEFLFYEWGQKDPRVALFRNNVGVGYWAGRQQAEFELSNPTFHYYTPQQTDWYGLVVFSNRRKEHPSLYQVQIQGMNDCVPMTSGECVTTTGWPRDFSFEQTVNYWAVVGVCESEGDSKNISVFTQCDAKGTNLAYSASSGTAFIVGDFNHNALGTYYPTVTNDDPWAPYTVQCDTDGQIFPWDTVVEGSMGETAGQCGLIKIWDIYLETNITYTIGFTRSGAADVRLALFRNPGNGTYWVTDADSELEFSESGNFLYTAPLSDWYGLVVYADKRGEVGNYTIRISRDGVVGIDPEPVIPERFALYQNVPNPFNPTTTIRYDVPAEGGHVSLRIYDVNGRLVRTLIDGMQTQGEKSVTWDAKDNRGVQVSTGVYFCRIVTPALTETRKMMLIK